MNETSVDDDLFSLLREAGLDEDDRVMAEEGMAVALQSLAREPGLSERGRSASRARYRGRIANLASVNADRLEYPEIAIEQIQRPVFVTGLPRSGTTILHSILAQDPDTRTPLSWELQFPSPPPDALTYGHDPRIEAWNRANLPASSASGRGDAEFRKKHLTGAQLPEECSQIMGATLRGTDVWAGSRCASYIAWWLEADHLWDYQIHRRWLQHYQWRNPKKRWALKWPNHIFNLDSLLEVYPDACIVQLHRDPREVISSLSSFLATIRTRTFETIDPPALGREMLDFYATGADRALAFRTRHPGLNVVDIGYRALLADPMSAVRSIYDGFAIELTPQAEASMAQFIAQTPQHAHGEHRHQLSDYGLTGAEVEARMADYIAFAGHMFG